VIEKGGRSLILAHRGELIDQAVNTLDRIGVEAGIEKAGSYARSAYDVDCVVATVQTMQGDRLKTWNEDHFKLIIIDEAHHATATTYQRIIKHFRSALVLGVTATADRADESKLADVFESVAYEMSLWHAMTAEPPGPYLCRLKIVQCDVDIDLRSIRTTGGDFNQGDLEEIITPLIETLANAIRQEVGDRSTLVFTPDVGSAQAMATALQSMGLRADWISGDSKDRAWKLAKYQSGETQILANCALLTEGFDAPRTAAIVLCRPTKSRPLFSQMVGRGTRLSPGKTDCLVIDFNYITSKLDLVKPVDLFDTTHTDEDVLQIADEILKTGKDKDLLAAIEKATEENERRKVLRIKAREKQIRYKRVSYDPLAVSEVLGIPTRGFKDAVIHKATPKQVELLKRFKVDDPEGMSQTRARTMLDVLFHRSKAGLATVKQVSWCVKLGMNPSDARAMTFDDASAFLDAKFKRGA
jgi:superfamily II DNA or RNA helicase